MEPIKKVGVRELKNKLSAYLREIKGGHSLLVTDRGTVVAELRPPSPQAGGESARIEEWVRTGRLIPPRKAQKPLPVSPLSLPTGTAQRLLDEDRAE